MERALHPQCLAFARRQVQHQAPTRGKFKRVLEATYCVVTSLSYSFIAPQQSTIRLIIEFQIQGYKKVANNSSIS